MLSIQAQKQKSNLDNSILYYDARLMSNQTATGSITNSINPPVQNSFAVFLDQRKTAILDDQNDYYLSITRFTLDTAKLPLFQCVVRDPVRFNSTSPGNVAKTPYIISMSFNSYSASSTLEWYPEDKTAAVPDVANNINLYESSEYFSVYTYQHFVDIVNTAFKSAYDTLATLTALPTQFSPFMKYDRETKTFDIVVDALGFRNKSYDNTDTGEIQIYFNSWLYDMFSNVQADKISEYYQTGGISDYQNYLLRFSNNGMNVYDNTTNIKYYNPYGIGIKAYSGTVLVMNVEWSINTNICMSAELVFTTTQIGVNSSFSSDYIAYNNLNADPAVNQFQKEITDFSITGSVDSDGSTRTVVTYVPGVYRYIQLSSNNNLSRIDIFCYYRSTRGILTPIKINSNAVLTMKFMLVHKDLLEKME